MFLCSLVEELCTKEENDKTDCNFNFGHECIFFTKVLAFKIATIGRNLNSKVIFIAQIFYIKDNS